MAELLNAQNIRGVYYTPTGAEVVAVDDVSHPDRRGRGARPRRRVRLWQVDSRRDHLADRPAAAAWSSTARWRSTARRGALEHARIPRTWRGAVVSHAAAGRDELGQPDHAGPRSGLRRDAGPRRQDQAGRGAGPGRDRLVELWVCPTRALDAYPHQLSGGMKQRVVTVICTLLNPRLLIADEPTSALDVSSQKALIEMLLEMLEKKIMSGVIFITHDLPVLRTVANRIAVMYQGRIVETGPTDGDGGRPGAPVHPGAAELGADPGAEVRQDQDRGHAGLRPRVRSRLRR